ncbi:unnamed protein product [Caenorhabditis angaria]|uniref:ZMIZ1 N-terminal domain-containing protein n=1 Tax=Caenorhabditis angaria TaxID=860376 RepID=A0A9P1N2S7_9PELO|nr:unnamed protein product [Caenorhabditis angaria]
MGEDITYEEHVALNNMRLNSIRASLSDVLTFSQACVELTKWCSDQRAFTPHFEDNLLATLQVAMENGTKETFDFNLTHQLMTACFSHRKHLSKLSANRINRWYEQLRRMKKNGGRRKRAPPKTTSTQSENNNFVVETNPTETAQMWQSAGSSASGDPTVPPPQQQPMLPYGQMEGNASMYDQNIQQQQQQHHQRMMAMRMQQQQYPPGQSQQPPQMMRYPPQYAANQQQYQQMMRARAAAAAAHPPPPPPQLGRTHETPHGTLENVHFRPQNPPQINPNLAMDRLAGPINGLYVYASEHVVLEEFTAKIGSYGAEFEITTDAFNMMKTANYDMLLTVWTPMQYAEPSEITIYINGANVLATTAKYHSFFLKEFLNPGKNVFQFGYNARIQMHQITCEFVCRKSIAELRQKLFETGEDVRQKLESAKYRYQSMAHSSRNGLIQIPLWCAITRKRMIIPARHKMCTTPQCFDMAIILAHNPYSTRYFCNICNQWFRFCDVEIDLFLNQLLIQCQANPLISEIIMDRMGNPRPMEIEAPAVPEKEKPKKGSKKRQQQQQQQQEQENTLKRIKSETFVKHENPMFGGDLHTFSPAMPVSVPSDGWPKHHSPYGLPSPTKGLGPPTPATPSLTMHPTSVGSSMSHENMANGGHVAAGSAPYTPVSVGSNASDKNFEISVEVEDIFRPKMSIIDNPQLIRQFLDGTKDVVFENYKCLESPTR